jgi:ABC-2 type transport system permease protein
MSVRARRLRALILKEAREILRSPVPLTIAFAGPAILLLLFAFGLSLDIERVPVAVVIEQPTPEARDLAGAFNNVRYFRAVHFDERHAAEEALLARRIAGIVVLAGDFARAVLGDGGAPVQVLVDGVDGRTGRMVASYVESAVANWLVQRALGRRSDSAPLVQLEARIWFNPEIKSRHFLAPGFIALLMTVNGALLAGLIVAREWERGTMEALLATPTLAFDLLAAKVVSYLALALGGMTVTLWLTVTVLEVPFRGSFLVLAVAASLFMLCALSLGFLISAATRNQVRAGRLSLTLGYLPTIVLSGLMFDLRNAPEPIQWLSHLVSARYFVSILHTLFLAGDVWPVLLPNLAGMTAIAVVLMAGVVRISRKRLE